MTIDSSDDEKLATEQTKPLRLPIALALLLVNLFWLLISVERFLIPRDAVSEFDSVPGFAQRSAQYFENFAGLMPVVLPLLAVLLVTHVKPVLPTARLVVVLALGQYAFSALLAVITFISAFFYKSTYTNSRGETTVYYTWRNAVEDGFERLGWLVLLGIAILVVVKVALPMLRGEPKPDRLAAYGQRAFNQPAYGPQGYPQPTHQGQHAGQQYPPQGAHQQQPYPQGQQPAGYPQGQQPAGYQGQQPAGYPQGQPAGYPQNYPAAPQVSAPPFGGYQVSAPPSPQVSAPPHGQHGGPGYGGQPPQAGAGYGGHGVAGSGLAGPGAAGPGYPGQPPQTAAGQPVSAPPHFAPQTGAGQPVSAPPHFAPEQGQPYGTPQVSGPPAQHGGWPPEPGPASPDQPAAPQAQPTAPPAQPTAAWPPPAVTSAPSFGPGDEGDDNEQRTQMMPPDARQQAEEARQRAAREQQQGWSQQ